ASLRGRREPLYMISESEVRKIAKLSKLQLNDDEIKVFAGELSKILGFAEKLDELDLKNVEATSHAVDMINVFREDKAVLSGVIESVLERSPDHDGPYFAVPKII
ncbi:MAG: glutamyl-tRNA(Gln) and/or aspartyl-tRNA(Asn) amidotransferase, C subunit, partial [uncultured bacterium]